jgi:N-acetylglucosamine kinase-like BadF-type ATPase
LNYIIGIDSGATSSEAVIMAQFFSSGKKRSLSRLHDLKIIRKKYQPVNFNIFGLEETVKRLKLIIKDISGKVPVGKVVSIAAGISGARYEKDRKLIAAGLKKAAGIKKITILPDTEIAFISAFDNSIKNCGILIAGTGSILYYKDSKGKIKRTGGWGRIIGDEGSGNWIAKKALEHVTKFYDRKGPKTLLANLFDKEFDINENTLIKKIYRDGFDIASAAKLVFRAAEKGDKLSRQIIKDAAEELALNFAPLKKEKYNIALTGSLFSEEKLLEAELRKIAAAAFPNIKLIKPALQPVWGAVKIASREAAKIK